MSSQKNKKGGLQTTLSAKLNQPTTTFPSKQRLRQNSVGIHSVSPFEIAIQPHEVRDIKQIKNINNSYTKYFTQLIGTNEVTQSVLNESKSSKPTRQEKYRMACWKMLQKNEKLIKQIEYQRKVEKDWQMLEQYLKEDCESINGRQLIQNYLNVSQKLQNLEKEYEKYYKKRVENLEVKENVQNLSQIEKQFKKAQRNLRKQIERKEHYEQQCDDYQERLNVMQIRKQKYLYVQKQLQMKLAISAGEADKQKKAKRKKKQN